MQYVVGFLFNRVEGTVALIRKNRPAWQAGKLNGAGGKVEPGETPAAAMRREFREEAGVDVPDWDEFAVVEGDWGSVVFYRAFSAETPRTMEAEPVEVHPISAIPYAECIPNLSWLIPLALYDHDRYRPLHALELVSGGGGGG